MLWAGREGEKEEGREGGNKVTQFYQPGATRKPECLTLESDHDQGKHIAGMLSELLSVPLNNQ